jgi:hypothetical protein
MKKKVVRRIKKKSARGHFCTCWSKMEIFVLSGGFVSSQIQKSMHGDLD